MLLISSSLDQYTCKGAFVELSDDLLPIVDNGYGWKPLESIYGAYLDMIKEGKVQTCVPNGKLSKQSKSDNFGPWIFHNYTTADIEKSVEAFNRLLDAIEIRINGSQRTVEIVNCQEVVLPWTDQTALDAAGIQPYTFARAFCEETAKCARKLSFRYVAPGIRIPTMEEFIAQEFKGKSRMKHPLSPKMPVSLFIVDDDSLPSNHAVPNCDTWLCYDGSEDTSIPAGLYLVGDDRLNQAFENSCRLLLPFKLGSNGWARLSDYEVLGMKPWDDEARPADVNSELYQSGYNGFLGRRDVQIHKVLLNWAQRVECGDWTVAWNGVESGIEKFHEADTEANWQKYWLPLSW